MSINQNCPNRVKPKLLREQKNEALLVFIRTTLEQYFNDVNNNKVHFQMGSKEDIEVLQKYLKILLDNLQETVSRSVLAPTR